MLVIFIAYLAERIKHCF